jgi:hypothetical protein
MKKFVVERPLTGEKLGAFDCVLDAMELCRLELGSRVVRLDGKTKVPLTMPPTPAQRNRRWFTA